MLPVTLVIVFGLPGAGKSNLCSSLLRSCSLSCPSDCSCHNKHCVPMERGKSDTRAQNLNKVASDDDGAKEASNVLIDGCFSGYTRYVHVCFDSLIPSKEQERYAAVARSLQEPDSADSPFQCSTESDSLTPWKKARRKVYGKVEQFLGQVRQCEMNGSSLSNLISSSDFYSNSSTCDDNFPSSLVILLDDNFYYRSMRQPYYVLAGAYGAGFCEVLVRCSKEEALVRNGQRCAEAKVPSDVIKRMARKMEPADPLGHSWEKRSLEVASSAGEEDFDRLAVLQLVKSSLSSPVILSNSDEARELRTAAATESRIVCSRSVLHQADLVLRQLVTETAKKGVSGESASFVDGNSSAKDLVREANAARHQMLKEMKSGVSGLPQCLSEEFTPDMKPVLSTALRANFWQKMKLHSSD